MKTLARPRDKAEILKRLRQLHPESSRRWGRMSVGQAVCHMADALRMALGEQPVTDATGPLQRTLVKWIALYAPMRWPPGIPTSPELDQVAAAAPGGEFAADVARVAVLLELLAKRTAGDSFPLHPTFGRLSHAAWLRWGYLHMDHHLRQFGA